METEPSDAELVRRIADGDPDAEAAFCRRMGPRVHLFGLRHTRDRHLADDLMQQVLMTTLQALRSGRLREPERLASFVLGMCRTMMIDLRRGTQRKQRVHERLSRHLPAWVDAPRPDLDREQLTRCLQALPERERTVVVMSFYDDQTGQDIAGALGLSQANVRVIRHRAIHQLRRCMGADDADAPQKGATR
jgi:RNA polymerase sigma-70 factor (ECF subfamily)